jgi:hypothetical protein
LHFDHFLDILILTVRENVPAYYMKSEEQSKSPNAKAC